MEDPTQYCLERLGARGFDKSQVHFSISERDELQAEFGKPNMFRTVANASLVLTGIVDGKRASVTLNGQDAPAIDRAIDSLWLSAEASMSDDANNIAEFQPSQSFEDGIMNPDRDAMYDRPEEFLTYTSKEYPTVTVRHGERLSPAGLPYPGKQQPGSIREHQRLLSDQRPLQRQGGKGRLFTERHLLAQLRSRYPDCRYRQLRATFEGFRWNRFVPTSSNRNLSAI